MAEIYQLPSENSGNAGMGNIPFSIPIGGIGMGNNGFGFGSPLPSADFLKQKLEEDDNKEKEQVFAIPAK